MNKFENKIKIKEKDTLETQLTKTEEFFGNRIKPENLRDSLFNIDIRELKKL